VAATMMRSKWGINLSEVRCPKCGLKMPRIRKPTSFQQALWGSWTCPQCGTAVNKYGAAPRAYRKCPACAEEVLVEALRCRHCGERLDAAHAVNPPGFCTEWGKQIAAASRFAPLAAKRLYREAIESSHVVPSRNLPFSRHGGGLIRLQNLFTD